MTGDTQMCSVRAMQMRLKHAHSVTAELKQDAESKRRDKNVIARLVDAKDESHKSDIECN